jgi:imidazolonepropionase-like amidohydrolase
MKERGTYLVPTRSAGEWVYAHAKTGALPPYAIPKALEVGPVMRDGVREGVQGRECKIAFGTDAGVFPHGENAQGVRLHDRPRHEADGSDRHATGAASDLLGWNEVGRIEKGRYATSWSCTGDPLQDITLLEKPVAVLKGGAFVLDDARPRNRRSSRGRTGR